MSLDIPDRPPADRAGTSRRRLVRAAVATACLLASTALVGPGAPARAAEPPDRWSWSLYSVDYGGRALAAVSTTEARFETPAPQTRQQQWDLRSVGGKVQIHNRKIDRCLGADVPDPTWRDPGKRFSLKACDSSTLWEIETMGDLAAFRANGGRLFVVKASFHP